MIPKLFEGKLCTEFSTFSDRVEFVCLTDGKPERFVIYHPQDCCESVYLDSVEGKIPLSPFRIIKISETCETGEEECGDVWEKQTYVFDTDEGNFVLKFYGTSNGYYGTSVFIGTAADYARHQEYL